MIIQATPKRGLVLVGLVVFKYIKIKYMTEPFHLELTEYQYETLLELLNLDLEALGFDPEQIKDLEDIFDQLEGHECDECDEFE